MVKHTVTDRLPQLSGTLILATLSCLALYAGGVLRNQNFGYSYMAWNLFLAWLPLLLVLWLCSMLGHKRWTSWQGITISIAWLGFLPNSFYMVSDYIHLRDAARLDVLYDAVMLTAFVCTGLILGYLSLYMFHGELSKRLPPRTANTLIAVIIFLCSCAIYLGRDLRWNTWDLFLNPAGILFDVSDRLINPRAHPQMFVTILSFFVLLGMLYLVIRAITNALRTPAR